MVQIIFGMLVAVWASDFKTYRYFYGQWRYSGPSCTGRLFRIIIEIIPTALVYLAFGSWFPKTLVNAYLKYIAKSITMWCIGFLLLYGTRPILLSLDIIRERDEREPIYRQCLDCC